MNIKRDTKATTSFGIWLRSRRRLLDLTQQALADQVGCARVTVRNIESGGLKPSRELTLSMLEKLDIPEIERPHWVLFARGLASMPARPGDSSAHRPGVPSGEKPLSNLPVFLTTFIGREKEQAQIIELIGKHRLVTFTGSGGIGKTRLSVKVGEQLLANFGNGVWLVELASLSDPDLLPQTVAALFGLAAQSNIPATEILVNFLRTKTLLLVLDNCEHLLNSCALLADSLLKNCPKLKILATSREALGIMGEVTYRVPSLQLLDGQQAIEKIREYESIRLFEQRCQLVQPDFKLTVENIASVAQICNRLDGIPLAIELAAGRVNIFSPEQIATQLHECVRILTGGSRTALARQQTIRASMDWSWNLLTDSERILLRRLSVFAGGWTLDAAELVCNGDGIEIDGVSEVLIQLAEKSLVVVNQGSGSAWRYHLLETIRQYAREKLSEAGERLDVRNRHLEYFLGLAERAEPELTGPRVVEWLKRLEEELDNIRAALEWSLKQDAQVGLRLASALLWFWDGGGYLRDGYKWLAQLLRQPETQPHALLRARALGIQGYLLVWSSSAQEASPILEESFALSRDLEDKQGLAFSLLLQGLAISNHGDSRQGRQLVTESLALYRVMEDKFGTAWALTYLGGCIGTKASAAEVARVYLEEGLAICREMEYLVGMVHVLVHLGQVALEQGDYRAARPWLEESLALQRRLGKGGSTVLILQNLEILAMQEGNVTQARVYHEESLSVAEETGNFIFASNASWTLAKSGYVALRQGDTTHARSLLIETQRRFKEADNTDGVVYILEGLASLAVLQGQLEQATRLFSWADATREAKSNSRPPAERADVDRDLATIHAQLDEAAFAAAHAAGQALTMEEAIALALDATHE